MVKNITCIECPKGCLLSVDIENCRVVKVTGNKCPKGLGYAISEVENPMRIFTSAVLSNGLELKMVPVRTDKPIPKADLMRAMDEIKKIRLDRPVQAGDVVIRDFIKAGVSLVATRACSGI